MSGSSARVVPGLPTRRLGDLVVVGPSTEEGAPGCDECAERWALDVRPETVPASGAETVKALEPVLARLKSMTLATGQVIVLDTATGAVSEHSVVPHDACSRCRPLLQTTQAKQWDLRAPQPAVPGGLRTRAVDGRTLRASLVDWLFGPIASVYRDEESPFPLVTAEAVVAGHSHREGGYGRANTFAASEVPALIEAMERVLGGHRQSSTKIIRSSYEALETEALDPRSLARHADDAHERVGFAFRRFDPSAEVDWVEGRWLSHDRPVLVPAQLVFWHENDSGNALLYESSNGCAVGSSLEEAALHGFFEIVERDGFLLAWYGRLRLREIDIAGTSTFDDTLLLMEREGLRLRVLDATSDLGIPTAIAVVTASDDHVRAGRAPAFSLAAGAHSSGIRAITAAVKECVTNALMYPKWVRMRDTVRVDRYRPLLDDHDLVEVLEDHTGMHGLPEARALWGFLDDPSGCVPLEEFNGRGPTSADVVQELQHHLDTAGRAGVDVLAVDQSASYLREFGLFAVKVLAPGTMPMTFGHLNRRLDGVPRLARAASIVRGAASTGGWRGTPPPHPFP